MSRVLEPYPVFTGLDNRLLDNGYVWFGLENQDPETDPVAVFSDPEMTISVSQPLRTKAGLLSDGDDPINIYIDGAYSIRVRNFIGVQVLYLASVDSLSGPSDSSQISFLQAGADALQRTVEGKLREVVSVTDFGAVDDWNGTTGTNNFAAFEAVCALSPVTVKLPKSYAGTGVYMVNGDTALLDAEGVVLDPDPGVSIHVVGTGAPQTALPGLAVTRDLRTDYTDLRYQRALSPTMRKRITELGRPASALDGQLQVPIRLDFADATHWQLGSWPSGTFATATPTSVAADLVQWGTPPASSFVASLFHVVPGDYIQAGLSNITTCLPAIAIFTDSGWVLVRQSQTSGLDTLVITEKVGASPSVETSTINPVVAQTNYRMAKSSVGIIIYDQRSFGLVLNGVVIRRYRTTGNIQRAGWAGGFGTAGNFYVGNPVLYKGKRTFGIKPLKVLSIGDSTGDENVTGQSQFDFARQFIGGVGGCQIETLTNLAHSGDTSAAQLSALQAVTLTGAGYDYCLIQIGINDIQTSVAVATFVDNVMDMVDYCRADGVEPIVGIPAMFYSQTDAQAYGQDGGPTSNSAAGAGYRLALMEALADARVYCNLASFEDMGAVVASLLAMKTSPWGDQVVADNIHPTAWGSMLLGYGWAKGIAAHLTQAQEQDLASGSVAAIPLGAPYFTGGVGVTSTPQYSVVGSTFHLSWYLSRDGVSLADDTLVGTLPKRLRPPVDVFAPLVNVGAAPTLTPIAATPAGFWKISADGKIRVYGVAGSPTFMGISASWKI